MILEYYKKISFLTGYEYKLECIEEVPFGSHLFKTKHKGLHLKIIKVPAEELKETSIDDKYIRHLFSAVDLDKFGRVEIIKDKPVKYKVIDFLENLIESVRNTSEVENFNFNFSHGLEEMYNSWGEIEQEWNGWSTVNINFDLKRR